MICFGFNDFLLGSQLGCIMIFIQLRISWNSRVVSKSCLSNGSKNLPNTSPPTLSLWDTSSKNGTKNSTAYTASTKAQSKSNTKTSQNPPCTTPDYNNVAKSDSMKKTSKNPLTDWSVKHTVNWSLWRDKSIGKLWRNLSRNKNLSIMTVWGSTHFLRNFTGLWLRDYVYT